jgi:hypothetical protein
MRHRFGSTIYFLCTGLALLLLLIGGVDAVGHGQVDDILTPAWVAALLYFIGFQARGFAKGGNSV